MSSTWNTLSSCASAIDPYLLSLSETQVRETPRFTRELAATANMHATAGFDGGSDQPWNNHPGSSKRIRAAAQLDDDSEFNEYLSVVRAHRPQKRRRESTEPNNTGDDLMVMPTSEAWRLAPNPEISANYGHQSSKRSRSTMEHDTEAEHELRVFPQPAKRQRTAAKPSEQSRPQLDIEASRVFTRRAAYQSDLAETHGNGATSRHLAPSKARTPSRKTISSANNRKSYGKLKVVTHGELLQMVPDKVLKGKQSHKSTTAFFKQTYTSAWVGGLAASRNGQEPVPKKKASSQSGQAILVDDGATHREDAYQSSSISYGSTNSRQTPSQEILQDFSNGSINPSRNPSALRRNAGSKNQEKEDQRSNFCASQSGDRMGTAHNGFDNGGHAVPFDPLTTHVAPPSADTTRSLQDRRSRNQTDVDPQLDDLQQVARPSISNINPTTELWDPRPISRVSFNAQLVDPQQTVHAGPSNINSKNLSDPRSISRLPFVGSTHQAFGGSQPIAFTTKPAYTPRVGFQIESSSENGGRVPDLPYQSLSGGEPALFDFATNAELPELQGDEAIDAMFAIAPPAESSPKYSKGGTETAPPGGDEASDAFFGITPILKTSSLGPFTANMTASMDTREHTPIPSSLLIANVGSADGGLDYHEQSQETTNVKRLLLEGDNAINALLNRQSQLYDPTLAFYAADMQAPADGSEQNILTQPLKSMGADAEPGNGAPDLGALLQTVEIDRVDHLSFGCENVGNKTQSKSLLPLNGPAFDFYNNLPQPAPITEHELMKAAPTLDRPLQTTETKQMDPLNVDDETFDHGARFDQILSVDDPAFDFFDDLPRPVQSVAADNKLAGGTPDPEKPMQTTETDHIDSPRLGSIIIDEQDPLAEEVVEEEVDDANLPSQEDNLAKLAKGFDEEAWDDFMGRPLPWKYRARDEDREPLVTPIWHNFSVSPEPEQDMGGGR